MMARWGLTDAQVEAILNMRLRALRRLEESRDPQGAGGAGRRVPATSKSCSAATAAMAGAGQGESPRPRRNSAAIRALGRRRTTIGDAPAPLEIPVDGADRARGGDRALLGEGLDPRRQGPQHRRRRAALQGRRRAAFRGAGRNHRPADDLRQQRAVLHARRRSAARRARPGRAAAADDRPAERARGRRHVPLPPRHETSRRGQRRARLYRRRRGGAGADPRRQAGADPGQRRDGVDLRPGQRRRGRLCRREPAHAGRRSRRNPGDGARPRRHPAALPDRASSPTPRCFASPTGCRGARARTAPAPRSTWCRGAARAAVPAAACRRASRVPGNSAESYRWKSTAFVLAPHSSTATRSPFAGR